MSIPLEYSASEEAISDFDVSTGRGYLNTPDLGIIEGTEESLGYNSSPTASILSCTPSGGEFRQSQAAQTRVREEVEIGLILLRNSGRIQVGEAMGTNAIFSGPWGSCVLAITRG